MKQSRALAKAIELATENLFENAGIMLQTCDPNFVLCGLPIWKHVYHQFHSCDQWFINPFEYDEPDLHQPGLNSLNEASETALSKEELARYLEAIRVKVMAYLASLTDDMLHEIPPGCTHNRLALILAQHRHFYAHLGNINATTIIETNQWPRVIGPSGKSGISTQGLFE